MTRSAASRSLALALAVAALAACGGSTPGSERPTTPGASVAATKPPASGPASGPSSDTPISESPTSEQPTSVPTTTLPTPPPFDCAATLVRPGTVPLARINAFSVVNEAGIGRITIGFRPEGNVAAVPRVDVRPGTPPFARDPSGLPLEVAGRAFLVITLHGGTALDADFRPTFEGPLDATPAGGPIVEVRHAGDFEAVSTWVVGLDAEPCVRILPPDGSGTLVIEVSSI